MIGGFPEELLQPHPISTDDGLSLSFPYLLPFITPEQLESWASIPQAHAVAFSKVCLQRTIEIFSELERLGRISKISELRDVKPRASVPFCGHIDPQKRIVDLLEENLRRLSS